MAGFWDQLGPGIGTLLLIVTAMERILPDQLSYTINRFLQKIMKIFSPYTEITFHEFPSDSHTRSKAYAAIETYLGTHFSVKAERLNASIPYGSRSLSFSMDDYEEITAVHKGVKVRWMIGKSFPRSNVISFNSRDEERRAYILSFHRRHGDTILGSYLSHVLSEGKAIGKKNRRQMLYTNVSKDNEWGDFGKKTMWRNVAYEHPATFDTLAMDPKKKKDIMNDLIAFTKGKEYYKQIGKAWKRGYLLYGPPGTGKSTMIAAMANFLHYDVYDLELTSVKDNTDLRKLYIEISKRAIIVIEDIDSTLAITGKRKTGSTNTTTDANTEEEQLKDAITNNTTKDHDSSHDDEENKVTLSGLLNFIDGLWSSCGGERIIVFTTNYVDKLDSALIRTGRMDKHIEMSYCCFEGFKVLARNYLKVESHELFEDIRCLLQETNISPADVAENLMPKTAEMGAEECLGNLIKALHKKKDESKNREVTKSDAKTEEMGNAVKRRKLLRHVRNVFSVLRKQQ